MKFAIIAAGEGSRLSQEGVTLPKPLVRIGGEAMIDRLLRIFAANDADEIVVIVNRLHPETEHHLRLLQAGSWRGRLRIVVKTTPSSMHSFFEISPFLSDAPFCLTTVDTIFHEEEFADYIEQFRRSTADGLMAVTDFIDDEKPLYVGTDNDLNITGFFDENKDCQYISGGIYCLQPQAIETLRRCVASGQSRMRNFQRQLVKDGLALRAHVFSKILDVDHATDIRKAESFLSHAG